MKKIVFTLVFAVLLTGCAPRPQLPPNDSAVQESGTAPNVHLEDQSYYMDFVSKQEENALALSGTLYQNNNIKGLVKAEALIGTDLPIKGTLSCEEGNITLLCRRPDGSEITVAKGSGEKGQEITVDIIVEAGPGTNFFYFSGTDAVCEFQLDFGLAEHVSYYLTTSIPPDL